MCCPSSRGAIPRSSDKNLAITLLAGAIMASTLTVNEVQISIEIAPNLGASSNRTALQDNVAFNG